MIILLDTSTPVCRLRVVDGDESTDYEWEAGRTLARGLLGFLQEKTGDITHISGIGVMKGPGSFTGLRIGLAVVNTLADGLSVPIVGETGEDWQSGALERLRRSENDCIVLPLYGGEAHVTQPRK